jgi:hypothetical protein
MTLALNTTTGPRGFLLKLDANGNFSWWITAVTSTNIYALFKAISVAATTTMVVSLFQTDEAVNFNRVTDGITPVLIDSSPVRVFSGTYICSILSCDSAGTLLFKTYVEGTSAYTSDVQSAVTVIDTDTYFVVAVFKTTGNLIVVQTPINAYAFNSFDQGELGVGWNLLLIKLNADGDLVWSLKIYNSSSNVNNRLNPVKLYKNAKGTKLYLEFYYLVATSNTISLNVMPYAGDFRIVTGITRAGTALATFNVDGELTTFVRGQSI